MTVLIRRPSAKSTVWLDGIEVVGESANLQQGMDLFQTLDPNVPILDIKMPNGSGIRLLEAIQGRKHIGTVMMLMNYPYDIYRKRCMALGASFFFEKASEYHKIEEVLINLKSESSRVPA